MAQRRCPGGSHAVAWLSAGHQPRRERLQGWRCWEGKLGAWLDPESDLAVLITDPVDVATMSSLFDQDLASLRFSVF